MGKKRLLVTEQQLHLIFEKKLLQLLERSASELPQIAVGVTKEELINMMGDLNYSGHIQLRPSSVETPNRKKIIQISNEQLNKLVTKLLLINNTLENGEHVEGYKKDWVYYPDQYQRMPGFGSIVSP